MRCVSSGQTIVKSPDHLSRVSLSSFSPFAKAHDPFRHPFTQARHVSGSLPSSPPLSLTLNMPREG